MPSYRVEISPNNRAGCKNAECKKEGVKITKGEIRWGTLVTIEEHTSWAYKHWGCVTPQIIANVQEFINGDTDLLDGYDELPADAKAKVDFALEHGHVPDEDWKGDLEVNRPGQKGFRVKTPKKKAKKGGDEEEDGSPKPKKKRGRKPKDEDDEEAPAPKKARGKKAAVKEEEEEDEPKPVKKARGKKAAAKDEDAVVEEPKPRKARAAQKPAIKEDDSGDPLGESEEVEAPKAKRGRKKAAPADTEKAPPQKKGRKKKASADE